MRKPLTTNLSEECHEILDRHSAFGCNSRNILIERGVALYTEYYKATRGVCQDLLGSMEAVATRIVLDSTKNLATEAAREETNSMLKKLVHDPILITQYPHVCSAIWAAMQAEDGQLSATEDGFEHLFNEGLTDG